MVLSALYQQQQSEETLSAARDQARDAEARGLGAERHRATQEETSIRLAVDTAGRQARASASKATTVAAGAGIKNEALIRQWEQNENEMLGSIAAKERAMESAGDIRVQEIRAAKRARLEKYKSAGTAGFVMAGLQAYLQGKMIQQKLDPESLDKDSTLFGFKTNWLDAWLAGDIDWGAFMPTSTGSLSTRMRPNEARSLSNLHIDLMG
jgi:hypothetical protein